jgi:tetratricopeptide (TPR) repeat protein
LELLKKWIDSRSISATNFKPVYKYWLALQVSTRISEGRREEAAKALQDLDWIKDKLGYWATPFDRAYFLDFIGEGYERLQRPADAERAYREALIYNPHFAMARYHLGRLLLNLHREAEARRELRSFLSEWKDADPDLQEPAAARNLLK